MLICGLFTQDGENRGEGEEAEGEAVWMEIGEGASTGRACCENPLAESPLEKRTRTSHHGED